MTNRERALAALRYEQVDRMPVVHFGFLYEAKYAWLEQGHITREELDKAWDNTPVERAMTARMGFDFNWQSMVYMNCGLVPGFKEEVVAEFPDGSKHIRNSEGVVSVHVPGAGSIHSEVDHLLKDRRSWEEYFKPRLQWNPERVNAAMVYGKRLDSGGSEYLDDAGREDPVGLHCGSLYGVFRNWAGMENTCYMLADDEALVDDIINTIGDLCYRNVEHALKSGARFDFGHFWEDICYKNGPLVNPAVFADKVGPHYRRITGLLNRHGIDIVSLDCDGWIDALVPVWLENGVNTMFPIEVGTWNGSLGPWRGKYGRALRGVGGVNKRVFSRDRKAVDMEIERIKPLIEMGGYIPCPDHRIPEDCKYDLVCYYCEKLREL